MRPDASMISEHAARRGEDAMNTKRIALLALLAAGLAPGLAVPGAVAQTYPAKPIRMVVGFAAGGPADVMARLIGQRMTVTLGQPIVVDNRAGVGGTIAA